MGSTKRRKSVQKQANPAVAPRVSVVISDKTPPATAALGQAKQALGQSTKVLETSPNRAPWAPSARQASCAGLKKQFYPSYLRDLVDVDYEEQLSAAERQWLGAFLEEYYKGWRIRSEQQVHTLEQMRENGAAHQRLRRHQDVTAFGKPGELPVHLANEPAANGEPAANEERYEPRPLGWLPKRYLPSK